MASRPMRPCSKLGCFLAVRRQGECPPNCSTPRTADAHRGGSTSRGYGSRWQRRRAAVLREEPLCRHCLERGITTEATEVDHITPRARGGSELRRNLQALCKPCHSRKTAREDGGFGRMGGRVKSLQPPAARPRGSSEKKIAKFSGKPSF